MNNKQKNINTTIVHVNRSEGKKDCRNKQLGLKSHRKGSNIIMTTKLHSIFSSFLIPLVACKIYMRQNLIAKQLTLTLMIFIESQ